MLPAGGRQHRGCIIPQAVTHSLVLLKMGKIISRNMLSWRIINKPLLLHLVGCLYYLYQWCTVKQISDNEIHLSIKYIKSVLWRVAKRLSYIEDARCLKVNAVMELTLYFWIRSNIISPFAPRSTKWCLSFAFCDYNGVRIFLVCTHSCYMHHPSHLPH